MILGLDIRTTVSAAVYMSGGSPRPIVSQGGNRKGFPSCVMFDTQGDPLKAGGAALEEWDEYSEYVLRHFKRIIGYTHDEIQDGIRRGRRFFDEYRDRLERGSGGTPLIRVAGKTYQPEEIMAFFLDEIRRNTEEALDEPIDQAVIAIPAYFGPAQREAMTKSGQMVFRSVELIEEALAAILGCELGAEARERSMVIFDLGIGILEVVVAKIGANEDGKPYLIALNKPKSEEIGALDMDYAILEYLMNKNRSLRDSFPAAPLKERRRFLRMIEEARISLSSRAEARIVGVIAGETVDEVLTQGESRVIVAPIVKDCEERLITAFEEADLEAGEVGHLILVGGPTRMPIIRQMLSRIFQGNTRVVRMLEEKLKTSGWDPWPVELVAKGAAIYPGIDYKVVSVETGEAVLPTAQYTYGFFYDRLVPLIYKGDAFDQGGVIRRESTAIFPRPDGQIPVIQREEKGERPSYRCLEIFSFFLPLQDSYEIRLILELTQEGLKIIGRHHAIGEIVYPHISAQMDASKEKSDEITLLKDIQTMMKENADVRMGYYATMDAEAAKRRGEGMLKMLNPYARMPEMMERINDLTYVLSQLRKATDYSGSHLARQIEQRCAAVLNLVAETAFTLLRYSLISQKDYRGIIRLLHQVYRLNI